MEKFLARIVAALERMSPERKKSDFGKGDAFIFDSDDMCFVPVKTLNYIPFEYLVGIDAQKKLMLENTSRFSEGKLANNALLWGARGCGKSSLIKAVFMKILHDSKQKDRKKTLCLLEIKKNDLKHLNYILKILRTSSRRFIIYCDDLCFDENDREIFRYLKTLLEGSLAAVPDNVIFYATSNRRHLIRDTNRDEDFLSMKEDTDEGVALSDRFGLWIGFHEINQDEYLQIVKGYVKMLKLDCREEDYIPKALEWSITRGARSGRVAWQFVKSL